MQTQVDRLGLRPGDVVADLGSGLGAFADEVAQRDITSDVRIVEIDLISEALRSQRDPSPQSGVRRDRLSADFGSVAATAAIPLGDATCSAVIASLLISYVNDPGRLLREVLRVLRPGGRFVVSTLRRDADLSLIWGENEKALRDDIGIPDNVATLDDSLRSFFNDASRLMLLEEDGLFRFWESQELAELVTAAGFANVTHELALGDPPQAVVVAGTKP
jgi:ubiquinone/menaquinone biosynthesis C-methylase UbiE